ncbi:MAG: phosphotransferase [Chthoniobacterales bacterium]|nr:phosphotransferase [Chthoniobacterales bacterium]
MKKDEPPLRSPPQRAIAAAATGEIARQAANLWSAQSADPQPVRAVQNYVFSIAHEGAPAILRLTHESHRRQEEVEAELRWVLDLKERGIPVAVPFRSRRDRLTEMVESGHGQFVVSCFEYLTGPEPNPQNPALWNDRMFEQLGALTARLHQLPTRRPGRRPRCLAAAGARKASRQISTFTCRSVKNVCTTPSIACSDNSMPCRVPAMPTA